MIIQQLYRYIFNKWNHLSEQEKNDAPVLLKPFINNPKFQSAIKVLRADDLYKALYAEKSVLGYYHPTNDEYFFSWYSANNKLHKYFENTESKNNSNVVVFKSLHQLFELYYEITNPVVAPYMGILEHNISEFCYKLMVIFDHEDIMLVLSKLELYCESLNQPLDHSIFKLFSNFELGINPDNQCIDLPAWRELLLCKDLSASQQIFNIAPEIEKTLGSTPKTIEAAIEAAKLRSFENQDKYPEFAKFCIGQLISEEDFNAANSHYSFQVLICIIRQLPPGSLNEFIQVMPEIEVNTQEICELLNLLNPFQVNFIDRFADAFRKAITDKYGLSCVLRHLTTREAQQALVKCLGQKFVLESLGNHFDLILEEIHSDYLLEFIHNVISIEKLRNMMSSFVHLNEFMKNCLPDNNQVQFLKNIVGIEKIRALSKNHAIIVEQLKQLKDEEKIDYLKEIIGATLLNQVLDKNWCMLESVLKEIPADLRLSVMGNLIGIDVLREIIPVYGDLRAQNAIVALLPVGDRSLLQELLPTDEEKQAQNMLLNTKKRIEDFQFSTGFLGWGFSGEEITLDDNTKKIVPKTVKEQWNLIKRAEKKHISCTDAWEQVRQLGAEVKPTSGTLHYFFRAPDTKDYYKSFKEPPQLN